MSHSLNMVTIFNGFNFLRLEHPNKMLHSIFETFYQEDVIVEEAFIQWEQNTDPEAQVCVNPVEDEL